MKRLILSIALLPLLFACNNGSSTDEAENEMEDETVVIAESEEAVAVINPKSGSKITGTVNFSDVDGTVEMDARIEGLAVGNHAIHIHEVGDCSSTDGKSAGGHWNPTNEAHGKWDTPPFHTGDIGNLEVGEDGVGTLTLTTDKWCVGCEDSEKNIIGKAIIIHEGPDDFSSQPSGAAGPRIGCGEIVENSVM